MKNQMRNQIWLFVGECNRNRAVAKTSSQFIARLWTMAGGDAYSPGVDLV